MDENNLFREAFNSSVVEYIANQIKSAWPEFDHRGFIDSILHDLDQLNFGDRAKKIRQSLEDFLPQEYDKALSILVSSLGPEPEKEHLDGFEGFYIMPLCMFVSKNGLHAPDLSLNALYEMTKRFTAEGDIRPFIEQHYEKTMAFLENLTEDESPFARRLPSEGTRPRLPLAGRLKKFQADPFPVIELLDRLYQDPNLMVRRSVANNINDISKDNPEIAVDTLSRWKKENSSKELDWMIKHGLRTLIKANHQGALKLLGFAGNNIEVSSWKISTQTIVLGQSISFSFEIGSQSEKEQKLAINYIIHFMKANGKTKEKVFRMPNKRIDAKSKLTIEKTHKFLAYKNQSFYDGEHFLEITVNGKKYFKTSFHLQVPET